MLNQPLSFMCEAVLLYPRPLARYPGRLLLLPLLPHRPSLKPLPSEIWSRIFVQALFEDDQDTQSHNAHNNFIRRSCLSLMLVCKGFKASSLSFQRASYVQEAGEGRSVVAYDCLHPFHSLRLTMLTCLCGRRLQCRCYILTCACTL